VNLSIRGATSILKLQGIPITPTNAPISAGLLSFIANHAGMAKNVIPSGIPCAAYKDEKVKYLRIAFSDKIKVFFLW